MAEKPKPPGWATLDARTEVRCMAAAEDATPYHPMPQAPLAAAMRGSIIPVARNLVADVSFSSIWTRIRLRAGAGHREKGQYLLHFSRRFRDKTRRDGTTSRQKFRSPANLPVPMDACADG